MSIPNPELRPAVLALLLADAGVAAAFGAERVNGYDAYPEPNAVEPYFVLTQLEAGPEVAECIDGAAVEWTVDVWSRTDPPGKLEAERIVAAVCAALALPDGDAPALILASHMVTTAEILRAVVLSDINKALTAHGVAVGRLHTEPL